MIGYGPRRKAARVTAGVRIAFLKMSLTTSRGIWMSTPDFRGLDQSDKTTASYTLGMTMTGALASRLLGHPFLTNVSAYLAANGLAIPAGRRCDYVSTDRASGAVLALFESKGRSDSADLKEAIKDAKLQLAATPIASPNNFACGSAFDPAGAWVGVLDDPTQADGDRLDPACVFFAHYGFLVELLSQSDFAVERGFVVAVSPDGEFQIALPQVIYDAVRVAGRAGRTRVDDFETVLEAALGTVLSSADELRPADDFVSVTAL